MNRFYPFIAVKEYADILKFPREFWLECILPSAASLGAIGPVYVFAHSSVRLPYFVTTRNGFATL